MTIETATSILLISLAVAASCAMIFLAMRGRNASSSIVGGFAVVLFLLTALPNIEVFKGWGVETRIREQVRSAKGVLDEIKSITSTFATQAYNALTVNIWLGSFGFENLILSASDIDELAERIGSNSKKLEEARDAFRNTIAQRAALGYIGIRNNLIPRNEELERILLKNANVYYEEAQNYNIENFGKRVREDKLIDLIPGSQSKAIRDLGLRIGEDLKSAFEAKKVSRLLLAFLDNDDTERQNIYREWIKSHAP